MSLSNSDKDDKIPSNNLPSGSSLIASVEDTNLTSYFLRTIFKAKWSSFLRANLSILFTTRQPILPLFFEQ
ncbi:hypothetical protein KKA15_02785 [Patescibacteria group bacterium]|nr:hypothetical protein [Patescibacteria group bacterium]